MTTTSVASFILVVVAASPLAGQVDSSRAPLSEGAAVAWSLGGTLAPMGVGLVLGATAEDAGPGVGLLLAGAVVGPALGHLYAANLGHAAMGMAVRAAAGLMTFYGIRCGFTEAACSEEPALAVVGLGVGVVSMIYDIVTAPASVRRHNQRRVSVSVGPSPVGRTRSLAAWVAIR